MALLPRSIRHFFPFLLFAVLHVFPQTTHAQDLPETLAAQVRAIQATARAQSEAELKINSNLQQVWERMQQARLGEGAQIASADSFSTAWAQVDTQGRVRVALRVHEINSVLLEKLRALAFEVESSTQALQVSPRHQLVTGWVSFDKITAHASLPEVFHIRPVDRAMTQSGEVLTAGDAILRANTARVNFNVNGAGWKVGVLSDGVNHLGAAQASADLPPNVQVLNNRVGGDEGTALLEIIHDLAPGAALAFADNGLSEADFANNILLLRDAGAKIICDDVLYLLEPAFEDGLIAQTVAQVVANDDVVYVSAAGNHELDHYEGDFISNDGDSYHEFSSTPMDETMNVTLSAGSTILLVLQWNNAFGRSADNYDLIVFDANSSTILARSTDVQNGDDDPVEYLEYRNSFFLPRTIQIAVSKVSGASRRFKLYTLGSGVTPTQFAGTSDGAIYGHAAAAHALAIGAIDASDPNNDTIESFSAHGPARMYSYDNNGNPIAFEDRPKPDLIALDGVQTKVGQAGFFANPFFGTSAAAPHAAGIAALLREVAPQKTALAINAVLRSAAIDLGASGYDPIYGFGRIDALAAAAAIACTNDGDMNRDATLSPGDALCAFKLYLTNGAGPIECDGISLACANQIADVNCDGAVTPGDALAIFQRYLQGQAPFACFARSSSAISNAAPKTGIDMLQR